MRTSILMIVSAAFVASLLVGFTIVQPASADVIIDNQDAEAVIPGDWGTLSRTGQYGTDLRFGRGSTSNAVFTPNLASSGVWGVEMWWPTDMSSIGPTQTHVTVTHATGSDVVYVDQSAPGGQWWGVGYYDFNAGTGGSLAIDPDDSNIDEAVADAVRFRSDPTGMSFYLGNKSVGASGIFKSNVAGDTGQIIADLPLNASYDLSIHFNTHSNRDPAAIVRVYDGIGNQIDTTTVDLRTVGTALIGNYTFANQPIVEVEGSGGGYTDVTGTSYVLIPEPASLALVGIGAVAILRRRRHA